MIKNFIKHKNFKALINDNIDINYKNIINNKNY